MAKFVPGVELARSLYEEALAPALDAVPHSAALLGWGSEVLGFDTARSTDHGWGPRLQVFVDPDDVEDVRRRVQEALPPEFRGWPTRFGWDAVPVSDHVEVGPLGDWLRERLGLDPREGMTYADWLATPQQRLLELIAGAVFRDRNAELENVRSTLAWYPHDVWLWILACQWRRIDQEEPFVGRAAEVGDELGSRVIAARLVREVVALCFLVERRYAPYSKWLGSAFRRLAAHDAIGAPLLAVLGAGDLAVREDAFVEAIRRVAARHNELRVTRRVDETVGLFHGRPYRVLGSGRFVDACVERVADPWLRALPLVGAVDQLADSTDVLEYPHAFRALRALYETWAAPWAGSASGSSVPV